MPKQTNRVSLRLTPEAEAALDRLAPSVNKRGQYLSQLILAAAQPPPAPDPQEAAYAAIGRQVMGLARELARSFPDLLTEEPPTP